MDSFISSNYPINVERTSETFDIPKSKSVIKLWSGNCEITLSPFHTIEFHVTDSDGNTLQLEMIPDEVVKAIKDFSKQKRF